MTTSFADKGKPLASPRLDESGAITRAHWLGCDDPDAAELVEVYKGHENLLPGRYAHSATRPTYFYRVDGGPLVHYGAGIAELRRRLRRNFPNAKIMEGC